MRDEPIETEPLRYTPAALKAMASPLRRRILRHLAAHGPATSTTIGQALGQNTGTTSYHLRMLADAGFIAEIPDRAKGRERWWRMVSADRRMPSRDTLSEADRAVADQLDQARLGEDLQLLSAAMRRRPEIGDWMVGSRGRRYLTQAELHAFHDEYIKLLHRFGHDREDAPPDARPIVLRWVGFPEDDESD